MKLKIIGDKENNVIKQIRIREIREEKICCDDLEDNCDYNLCVDVYKCCAIKECFIEKECFFDNKKCCMDDDDESEEEELNCKKSGFNKKRKARKCDIDDEDEDMDDDESEGEKEVKHLNNNKNKKENIFELNNKENIMKMINTQDFIDGFWEENEYTKIIKEKYQKEFNLLKGLKNKNINDKTALTILVLYFINKEHPELLKDLIMIIKKGKIFIQKETNDNYENIIKEIGLK